jgi:hypothetical protein
MGTTRNWEEGHFDTNNNKKVDYLQNDYVKKKLSER